MQYSKIFPMLSTIVFILVLLFSFFGNCEDSTIILGALTASGSVALTAIVFYMKNSWIEKVSRIKIDVVKCVSEERLNYNKNMLLFLKENNLTQADLSAVEENSDIDEFDVESLDNLKESLNEAMSDASTIPDIQTISV